ncbi:MAG: helix-turn-helix domain-containing protein, partial [candidate division NC10 bacterium]
PVRLPALRERAGDIPLLASHFLERAARRLGKRLSGFTPDAAEWMLGHPWPGNVRELENAVERAAVLARGAEVMLADLRSDMDSAPPAPSPVRPSLEDLELQYIRRVLEEVRGDKRAAAKVLGVSVRTLQRKVKDL